MIKCCVFFCFFFFLFPFFYCFSLISISAYQISMYNAAYFIMLYYFEQSPKNYFLMLAGHPSSYAVMKMYYVLADSQHGGLNINLCWLCCSLIWRAAFNKSFPFFIPLRFSEGEIKVSIHFSVYVCDAYIMQMS